MGRVGHQSLNGFSSWPRWEPLEGSEQSCAENAEHIINSYQADTHVTTTKVMSQTVVRPLAVPNRPSYRPRAPHTLPSTELPCFSQLLLPLQFSTYVLIPKKSMVFMLPTFEFFIHGIILSELFMARFQFLWLHVIFLRLNSVANVLFVHFSCIITCWKSSEALLFLFC